MTSPHWSSLTAALRRGSTRLPSVCAVCESSSSESTRSLQLRRCLAALQEGRRGEGREGEEDQVVQKDLCTLNSIWVARHGRRCCKGP